MIWIHVLGMLNICFTTFKGKHGGIDYNWWNTFHLMEAKVSCVLGHFYSYNDCKALHCKLCTMFGILCILHV